MCAGAVQQSQKVLSGVQTPQMASQKAYLFCVFGERVQYDDNPEVQSNK